MKWKQLRKAHRALKKTRQRGDLVASALATEVYLRRLEEELDRVRDLLYDARSRGKTVAMDEAQQRMHRVINMHGVKKRKR